MKRENSLNWSKGLKVQNEKKIYNSLSSHASRDFSEYSISFNEQVKQIINGSMHRAGREIVMVVDGAKSFCWELRAKTHSMHNIKLKT